jgi:hypothetical protein
MSFDRAKFKTLVLHIVWRTSHTSGFGKTKLNKALWFAEARTFEAHGKPITGEVFVRDKFGPRSKNVGLVLAELEDDGLIEPFVEQIVDYSVTRFRARQPSDTSRFTPEELAMVDWWISHIADKHTGKSISAHSHDKGWELAEMGEELPLQAFLAKRIRGLETEEEREWARAEAERLGLK